MKKNLPATGRKQSRQAGAPPGPRKKEQRRTALIKAARKLFVKKGFESTTMDEIAASANVAKGTLYHYFSNKAELLTVLREEFESEVMKYIHPRVESCHKNDWRGRIAAWTEGAVAAYFEMYELHDVVIYGAGMPFRTTMANAQITGYLAELIGEGANAGAWDVDDQHWTAMIMFYSFRGGCDEAIMGSQHPGEIAVKLNDLFMRILGLNN